MDIMAIVKALLVVIGIIVGYLFVEKMLKKQKQSSQLLRGIAAPNETFHGESTLEEHDAKNGLAETFDNVIAMILPLFGKNLGEESESIKKKLMYAGIQSPNAPSYYLFFQYLGAAVLVLLAIPFLTSALAEDILVGVLMLVLAIWGPKLYIKNAIDKRKKTLIRSFPDALDLMLVCVESGLAMDAAFSRVCGELGAAHPDITKEFNRTRLELSLLSDRSKALSNLGERTDITAFKALAAALIQTEKFGTSLSDTLRVMSDDFRQSRLMDAEGKANRLPALMTIPLITMLLPALFIIILAPAIMGIQANGGIFGGG